LIMSKWVHRISKVDIATQTAICAACGSVEVWWKKSINGWVCKVAKSEVARRKRAAGLIPESQRTYRKEAVTHAGGKCLACGYNRCRRALHFHHVDPTTKEFEIGRRMGLGWKRVLAEANKCILVCGNCHAEIHDGLISKEKVLEMFRGSSAVVASGC
jgi:hypothetical protein